jgi:6-phosphogluconolactonase
VAIVTVLTGPEAMATAAAERVALLIESSLTARGRADVCLTGGRTPERLYGLLADPRHPWRDRIDWARVHVFWGDERHVPPDHPDSNFGMARRTLLARVPIPVDHIHRIRGDLADPVEAAREYEAMLRELHAARASHRPSSLPMFDVMLLGLGEDGHIASIFPASPLLGEPGANTPGPVVQNLVAAVWAGHLNTWRITLTPSALLNSAAILVLVSEPAKAPAVHAALDGPGPVTRVPAQLLRAAGDRVEWLIAEGAF